ncbi:hypothetical protein Ciccas_002187 [Cichlidogyrus casuarinus]|uniref:Protein FAM221A n=1 Tax=Cichlidogyrus casuarinus TaxID=1844966 RepID=A0ABD2QHX6_9PLAT
MSDNVATATEHVDAYFEYTRIVGEDDNGRPFTEQEFEAYKKRVTPMRLNNRIYVAYCNPQYIECVQVGPETQCFCQHKYIQHKTDFEEIPAKRPIEQKCKNCACKSFRLMPKFTAIPARCHCKHEPSNHSVIIPNKCEKAGCNCQSYRTSATCMCGIPDSEHFMLSETKMERKQRGMPIGRPTIYQAMGGLTGFNSLAPGQIRMDRTGAGQALTEEEINAPISSQNHPFLRAFAEVLEPQGECRI